jgi:hypothetical protein
MNKQEQQFQHEKSASSSAVEPVASRIDLRQMDLRIFGSSI